MIIILTNYEKNKLIQSKNVKQINQRIFYQKKRNILQLSLKISLKSKIEMDKDNKIQINKLKQLIII